MPTGDWLKNNPHLNPNPKLPIPPKEELEKLYIEERQSTWQLAQTYKVSQTQIRRWLIFHNIPRRTYHENPCPTRGKPLSKAHKKKISKALKGNTNTPVGEDHHFWKGENAGYVAKHNWMRRHYGSPRYCEICKRTDKKKYHWANISGKYLRNKSDYKRLCSSCHKKLDNGNLTLE